jgi:transglutaminase-like putative cysteine protease
MRFAVAHKTSSYLMVACAFFALLSGGGLPPGIALVGVVGLVASWWWEPPRVRLERWTLLWNIVTVAIFLWVTAEGVMTFDWFGSGATFLVWLVVARAFNRRSSRDWQQLYLLAFLMLVAGSVFNEGLSYAVAFLGFVIASTWALILSHLRREMEDNFLLKHADHRASERVEVRRILESRRIVGGRFFAGTAVVSLGVFLLSGILFLSIPRIGAGFFMKKRDGLHFAGFSEDGIKLGGHGTIKYDETIVMRVELDDPAYRGRNAPYVHWRGVAFDEYRKGQWRRTTDAPATQTKNLIVSRSTLRRHVLYDDARLAKEKERRDARVDTGVKQTIWVEPIGSDALFGASMPVAYDVPNTGRSRYERNDDIRYERESAFKYTVWSDLTPPPEDELRAAPKRPQPGYHVYLQWDREEITDETEQLALEITAGLTNDYDKARAIETYLRENLGYTLDLADPGGVEPIHFFLFDRKVGHCEYFASAFAILARINDIPTRQVNGFLGGEWNEYDGYIAVRAGDAHAWNEVYFAGHGWVTFDATPPSQDRLGRGGDGLVDRLRRWVDTLRFQWFKWVIDYDLGKQLGVFKGVGGGFKKVGRWFGDRWRDAKAWARDHWLAASALAAAVLALIGWRLWRRRRPGGPGASLRSRPRPRSAVAAEYERVLRRLERRGVARAPAVTPRELARLVAERGLPYAGALGELTEIYYAAHWGGDAAPALLERAQALARDIEIAITALPR